MQRNALLAILLISTGFGMPITGPEFIAPDVSDIARCMPEPMQELIHKCIANLPKFTKVTTKLCDFLNNYFDRNCKMLAMYLEQLDEESLINQDNIQQHLNEKDRAKVAKILSHPERGFAYYIKVLKRLDRHLLGHVSDLQSLLDIKEKVTIIDLINHIDMIQKSVLELQEFFQILSYLEEAHNSIRGYKAILDGMQHQLAFKIVHMVNVLCALTVDIRGTYLKLLSKGGCSDEQIVHALGIYFQKKQAIASE